MIFQSPASDLHSRRNNSRISVSPEPFSFIALRLICAISQSSSANLSTTFQSPASVSDSFMNNLRFPIGVLVLMLIPLKTLSLNCDQYLGAVLRPYNALFSTHNSPSSARPASMRIRGGRVHIPFSWSSALSAALRNAVLTSTEAKSAPVSQSLQYSASSGLTPKLSSSSVFRSSSSSRAPNLRTILTPVASGVLL